MADIPLEIERLHAEIGFTQELLLDFFVSQVDAGAALREEITEHIKASADRATASKHMSDYAREHVRLTAEAMVSRLPEGWASGDDWQEPA